MWEKFNFVYSKANVRMFRFQDLILKENWKRGPRASRKRSLSPLVGTNLVLY
jgi:hypothetical protein